MQALKTSSFVGMRVAAPSNGSRVKMSSSHVFNVEVVVGDSEPQDAALRRFRRAVQTANVVDSVRRRRYFENSQDEKKRKVKEAAKARKMGRNNVRTMDQVTFADNGPFGEMFSQNSQMELFNIVNEKM